MPPTVRLFHLFLVWQRLDCHQRSDFTFISRPKAIELPPIVTIFHLILVLQRSNCHLPSDFSFISRQAEIALPPGIKFYVYGDNCLARDERFISSQTAIVHGYLLPGDRAGMLEQYMEARNRVGIEMSYRPACAGILKPSIGARN